MEPNNKDKEMTELLKMLENLHVLRKKVDEQAEDFGLWFEAQHAPEAYLQKSLRELHALIEELTND